MGQCLCGQMRALSKPGAKRVSVTKEAVVFDRRVLEPSCLKIISQINWVCSMLSNSDIWLPRERDNVLTEIPQLVLCHWEEACVKKMGAVLCTDSNRQEKLLGALC